MLPSDEEKRPLGLGTYFLLLIPVTPAQAPCTLQQSLRPGRTLVPGDASRRLHPPACTPPPAPFLKSTRGGGVGCSEITVAAARWPRIEKALVVYPRHSRKRLPKISSRDILLFSLSAACNYAFKMFNVCKCISRFRW